RLSDTLGRQMTEPLGDRRSCGRAVRLTPMKPMPKIRRHQAKTGVATRALPGCRPSHGPTPPRRADPMNTSLTPSGDSPIAGRLANLATALDAQRRVRARRILTEAEELLRDTADGLEATGTSPADAERTAVDRFGAPDEYAARFRTPTGFDWL